MDSRASEGDCSFRGNLIGRRHPSSGKNESLIASKGLEKRLRGIARPNQYVPQLAWSKPVSRVDSVIVKPLLDAPWLTTRVAR